MVKQLYAGGVATAPGGAVAREVYQQRR